jgi:hypothetical protein
MRKYLHLESSKHGEVQAIKKRKPTIVGFCGEGQTKGPRAYSYAKRGLILHCEHMGP